MNVGINLLNIYMIVLIIMVLNLNVCQMQKIIVLMNKKPRNVIPFLQRLALMNLIAGSVLSSLMNVVEPRVVLIIISTMNAQFLPFILVLVLILMGIRMTVQIHLIVDISTETKDFVQMKPQNIQGIVVLQMDILPLALKKVNVGFIISYMTFVLMKLLYLNMVALIMTDFKLNVKVIMIMAAPMIRKQKLVMICRQLLVMIHQTVKGVVSSLKSVLKLEVVLIILQLKNVLWPLNLIMIVLN